MANKIEDALKDGPGKLTSSAFLLSRLFRRVLMAMDMDATRFNELVSNFVVAPGMTRKQETDARGRLRQALASPKISLGVFLDGFRLLKATRITFAMEVQFQDRPSVQVSESINFHHPLHNPDPSQTKH